jgi:hypothetical protein
MTDIIKGVVEVKSKELLRYLKENRRSWPRTSRCSARKSRISPRCRQRFWRSVPTRSGSPPSAPDRVLTLDSPHALQQLCLAGGLPCRFFAVSVTAAHRGETRFPDLGVELEPDAERVVEHAQWLASSPTSHGPHPDAMSRFGTRSASSKPAPSSSTSTRMASPNCRSDSPIVPSGHERVYDGVRDELAGEELRGLKRGRRC